MQVNELFKQSNTILLDGGMGTMLQAAGLKLGARPEELNITDPALIEGIHAQYAAAGSRIVNANTFGASAHKLAGSAYTLEQIITAGIENCKRACAPYGALTALDVGPLGELLEPSGTLAFEDAVAEYARIVKAGEAAGADLIFFETYTDLYELKAALLAAKENTRLPILASMSFEAGGRTFTGCTVESFAATARGLGADAVGINCSLGPKAGRSRARQLPGVRQAQRRSAPGRRQRLRHHPAAVRLADEALPGAAPVCCRRLLRHHPGVHQAAQRRLCRLHPGASRAPDALGAVHPGGHRYGGRHHGGGRAHQPHRKKALPAGTAGGRHELCAGTGRQSGRSRSTGSGRECGRTRRG